LGHYSLLVLLCLGQSQHSADLPKELRETTVAKEGGVKPGNELSVPVCATNGIAGMWIV
jgi:hypothetical protein